MRDGDKVNIDGKQFFIRKVKLPFCTGCYFFKNNCPMIRGIIDCSPSNGTHDFILTKKQYEKAIFLVISPLLSFGV